MNTYGTSAALINQSRAVGKTNSAFEQSAIIISSIFLSISTDW